MLIEGFCNRLKYGIMPSARILCPWYITTALQCLEDGHCHFIKQRNSNHLYLARFWLTEPKRKKGKQECGKFESGNSVLLHYFASADDDDALHSHPWESFKSHILEGWYDECVPTEHFLYSKVPYYYGPDMVKDCEVHRRKVGQTIFHHGSSLHSVVKVRKHTWTLVTTGPRIDNWGFFPAGKEFVDWRTYLCHVK